MDELNANDEVSPEMSTAGFIGVEGFKGPDPNFDYSDPQAFFVQFQPGNGKKFVVGSRFGTKEKQINPDVSSPALEIIAPQAFENVAGAAQIILMKNRGPKTLNLHNIGAAAPFSADTTDLSLLPWGKDFIQVSFDGTPGAGKVTGTSNDPDNANFQLLLKVNDGSHFGVGDAFPSAGQWSCVDMKSGNTISLDGAQGITLSTQPAVILWFSSWCPCSLQDLQEAAAIALSHPEYPIVAINTGSQGDDVNNVAQFMHEMGVDGIPNLYSCVDAQGWFYGKIHDSSQQSPFPVAATKNKGDTFSSILNTSAGWPSLEGQFNADIAAP